MQSERKGIGTLPLHQLETESEDDVSSTDSEQGSDGIIHLPYLFVCSFSESKRGPRPHSCSSSVGRPRSPKVIPHNHPKPTFLVNLPKPELIQDGINDPWTLRCVCEEKTVNGLLVSCEKCQNWQHGICVGLNAHTVPDSYICELCGNRPIRCKCGNNLNYRFSIIQCTSCGYYVHRRCVGLQYGPLPRGDFICNFCGKSKWKFSKIHIPSSFKMESETAYTFSQEKIENFHAQLLNGPFNDFLTIDVAETTMSTREFCECLYNRFRSFFFVCHPLNQSPISKKKRHNLLISFLTAAEYICHLFYDLSHDGFVDVFNTLIFNDLYMISNKKYDEDESGCEFTENSGFEIPRLTNLVKFQVIPSTPTLQYIDGEIICDTELKTDTFIGLAEGLIGDLEEFNYDNGVDSFIYQITDTRLVLDTTHISTSPLHKMKRSIYGNCVLKLFQMGNQVFCGIFIGPAHLSVHKGEEIIVKPGTPLAFGIDFMPAVLEDVSKWIGWHCSDLEEHNNNRPSRDERELQAAMRQFNKPKLNKLKPKKDNIQFNKKPRGRKQKKKFDPNGDLGLFDLFEADGSLGFLFTVTDDVEAYRRSILEQGPHLSTGQKTLAEPNKTKHRSEIRKTHSVPLGNTATHFEKEKIEDIVLLNTEFEKQLRVDTFDLSFTPLSIPDPILSMKRILGLDSYK